MGMIKNFLVHRRAGLSKVAGCRQISPPTQLVSADYVLCLAFLYGWHCFKKISLDWPLTLTTQSSTSKLSDNPGRVTHNNNLY